MLGKILFKAGSKLTTGQRRALTKAITASARKRATQTGKALSNSVNSYKKSVINRSAARKAGQLNKVSRKRTALENRLSYTNQQLKETNRTQAILKAETTNILKASERNIAEINRVSKKSDNFLTRMKKRNLDKEKDILTADYNKRTSALKVYNDKSVQLEGIRAQTENKIDALTARYNKLSKKNLSYQVGTVARDVLKVSAVAGAASGGLVYYNNQKSKKS